MAAQKTLVLGLYGTATLVDEDDDVLWDSDGDEDIHVEVAEYLLEDDADDVLQYLKEKGFIAEGEMIDVDIEVPEEDGTIVVIPMSESS